MILKRWSRLQKAVALCSLVYAGLFIIILITKPGGEQFRKDFFNLYEIAPLLFGGICNIVYAQRGQHSNPSRRMGWFLIGLGSLSLAIGDGIWTYYETVRRVEAPFPSWGDVGYLGLYPFLISGLVLLFGSMSNTGRARLLLDSAITATAAGVLSWYFLIQPIWYQSNISLLGKYISGAYPMGDIMALFGALVLFNAVTRDRTLRCSLICLASGIALWSLGDSLYAYDSLNGTYQTGSWYDWSWSFGGLLVGFAALLLLWCPSQNAGTDGEQSEHQPLVTTSSVLRGLTLSGVVRTLTPYIAVIFAFAIVAANDYHKDGFIDLSVCIAGGGLILLVILRQVLTLLENQQLTIQLRAFNTNLEQIVVQRTQQLMVLHQLTKAVNNTLQVDQVLSAAVEHTQQALHVDAVALWLVESDVVHGEQPKQVCLQRGLDDHSEILDFVIRQAVHHQAEMFPLPINPREEQATSGTCLRAPLLWQQRVVGAICVVRWHASFGHTEAETLESIGWEVGTALENARLYGAAVSAADRDALTGLFNHRAIHQRLDAEFHRASVQGYPLSVIMMDMNDFKFFNDTYGHPAGDQVLKRVAQTLQEEFRKSDILGRYGGDEFIAILPYTDGHRAKGVALRLHDRMMREGYRRPGDERSIPVTLSFGIAAFPADGANRHELIAIADANLYAAKLSEGGIKDTSELQRTHRALRADGSFEVLDAMVTAVDNKDRYTRRHSEDVTEYALWIAEELGLSEETMRVIRMGGLLHDVGKIGVPDEILRKPGRLTPEEYEVMKRHPHLGALIVAGVPGMEPIIDIVRSHHERWDGQGYPDGLACEDIPLLGRLLAVADAFSAMTTARPYRKGLEWDVALEQIIVNLGTQFDPVMARAFLSAAEKHRPQMRVKLQPEENDVPNRQEALVA